MSKQEEKMAEVVKLLAMCLAILGLMSLQAFGSPVESDGKMTGGTSWSSISKATKYFLTGFLKNTEVV